MKFACLACVAMLVAAALFIGRERCEIERLRRELQLLQRQQNQSANLIAENARLSTLLERGVRSDRQVEEPTRELLRLRGALGELRRELASSQSEPEEVTKQRHRELELCLGVESNTVPMVDLQAKRGEVSAELTRVGAHLLKDEDDYIYAEVFPTRGVDTNRPPSRITMEFYFADGALEQTRYWPKNEQAATP